MNFITNQNEVTVKAEKSSTLTDVVVLLVTILLFVISVCIPFWKATAETSVPDNQVVVSLTEGEYSALLSSLFGRVDQSVPENAYEYVRDIDEYRVRVAQSIEENNRLTKALHALVENFPRQLREGYREEIDEAGERVNRLKIRVFEYTEDDTFLSDAITEQHDLYRSFTEWLIYRINGRKSVERLNEVREESQSLRKDIALLYTKINSITLENR